MILYFYLPLTGEMPTAKFYEGDIQRGEVAGYEVTETSPHRYAIDIGTDLEDYEGSVLRVVIENPSTVGWVKISDDEVAREHYVTISYFIASWAGTRRQSDSVIEVITGFTGTVRVFIVDIDGEPVDLSGVPDLVFSVAHRSKTPTPMTNLNAVGGVGYFDVDVTAITVEDTYIWSLRGTGVAYKGKYLVEWAP